uniref:AT-hook motif nuclear-localized protein n=2 Tax=Cicer arietinum TaxID=3827 RepID=A0A1S2YY50_CICAR|nr:AT-hook motif nuclear-localized protein 10 [Cicer arietinum]
MDSREPIPPHSHPQSQPLNIMLVGPNPFANNVPTTLMAPATARFPPFNVPSTHSEPFNDNRSLKPCDTVAVTPSESLKKKRGRPRKYFPEGNVSLGLGSGSASGSGSGPARPPPITTTTTTIASPTSSTGKKKRGRPLGSKKKNKQQQQSMFGVSGSGVTPHAIVVNPGEDIVAKLTAFLKGGPYNDMCILAAHGTVGSVSLYQSGGIVNYEGQFELISLSCNLEISENSSGDKKISSLKVSLAGFDGRLLGGVVAGKLTAASSTQITLGGFTLGGKKLSSNDLKSGPSSTSPFVASGTPTSPTSEEHSSGDSSGDGENSPFSQGPGIYNNADQSGHNVSIYQQLWARQTQQ